MSGATEALSYAHLFDQCTQDWFSVASILEDLLTKLKARNPLIQRAYLKSDEAGCYHNSSLIAAVRDIAKRVGVTVHSYHYSEPQSGKDICDRILCPLKSSIRMYCNEGHDVLTAADVRDALNNTTPGKRNICRGLCSQRVEKDSFGKEDGAVQQLS